MSIRSILVLAGLLLTANLMAEKVVIGYVQNDGDSVIAFAESFDFGRVTHLNIAFENPVDGDGNLSYQTIDDELVAKAHAAHRKVLVSIGGGGAAEDKVLQPRYFDLIGDAKRAGFVAKLAAYVDAHHLDGLDVDLEGPSINKDYGAFVHDLAAVLKPKGKLVTAALSQGYGGDQVSASALADLDFANIMAYDATGPWNPDRAGQHSSIDFAKQATEYWLGRGLPKSKAVLGVPFYGYGFGKAYTKWGFSFAEIVSTYPGAETSDQVGDTIWYNGIPTIQAKVKYVVDQDLAGVMIWELKQDAPGAKSLLSAIEQSLHPSSEPFLK